MRQTILRKRGLENSVIKGAVIGLALLIVMILFLYKANILAKDTAGKQLCRQSVEANARLKLSGLDFSQAIQCQTRYEKIKGAENEKIKRDTANLLADCWYQYGEGELELFDTNLFGTQNDVFCAVCHQIEYEEKGRKINGFLNYLVTESPPNARDTYYDYLTPFSSKQASEKLLESNAPDFINTDFDYATVFVYAKKKGFWSKVTTAGALGTVGLVAGGTVAGFFTGGV